MLCVSPSRPLPEGEAKNRLKVAALTLLTEKLPSAAYVVQRCTVYGAKDVILRKLLHTTARMPSLTGTRAARQAGTSAATSPTIRAAAAAIHNVWSDTLKMGNRVPNFVAT